VLSYDAAAVGGGAPALDYRERELWATRTQQEQALQRWRAAARARRRDLRDSDAVALEGEAVEAAARAGADAGPEANEALVAQQLRIQFPVVEGLGSGVVVWGLLVGVAGGFGSLAAARGGAP
jgi:hypothetical protein